MIFNIIRFIVYIPLFLLYPTIITGKKNIPKGGAILVCNHLSLIDPIIIGARIGRKKYGLAKKELFSNKFKTWLYKKMGGIPVDRQNFDLAAIKTSISVLKKGKLLLIFPEGTRSKAESTELQEIKNGSAMLSIKTGCPICPMWIKRKPKLFVFNRIKIGKPFYLEDFQGKKFDKETLDAAGKIISEKINENKEDLHKNPKNK